MVYFRFKSCMGLNVLYILVFISVLIIMASISYLSRPSARHHNSIFSSSNSAAASAVTFPVCVLANAQSVETAKYAADQWPHFPFFFAVWDEQLPAVGKTTFESETKRAGHEVTENIKVYRLLNDGRVFLIPAKNTTHAEGWHLSLLAAARMQTEYFCMYYFTMDDDLQWELTERGLESLHQLNAQKQLHGEKGVSVVEVKTRVLVNFLTQNRPFVTVFPWPWGDNELTNLREITKEFQGELVQPATAFDNGCLIFHSSVVKYFIPIYLGPIKPRFINQHSFLNMFIPFMFRERALRFNGLKFTNPANVRHSYDDPAEFNKYLDKCARCLEWGPRITLANVKKWWPPKDKDFVSSVAVIDDFEYDLRQISQWFNVSCELIKSNPAVRQRYTEEDIEQIAQDSYNREPNCV